VLLLPVGLATSGADLVHPHVLLLGLVVALASSVLPYSLELVALRRLPERTFGVLLSLEPGLAALVGFLLLGQGLPWTSVLAIAVVVVASVGSTASARREGNGEGEHTTPPVVPGELPTPACGGEV
jgi:inner membrane transporter RhtA